MPDFKLLISTIQDAIDSFKKQIPGIEQSVLDDLQLLMKQLDLNGKRIKTSAANLRLLAKINGRLRKIILTPEYMDSVKAFTKTFPEIIKLQNDYFGEIESKFKPPTIAAAIQEQAVQSVYDHLTAEGLGPNLGQRIRDMLRLAVTNGMEYNKLSSTLRDFLTPASSEGYYGKWTGQITTDALQQFSGTYGQIISNDLGFEWFRYSGSNIDTTRPFCRACTTRKWFHISELPEVLKGNFKEFEDEKGIINPKTGLPEGMYAETDVSNFQVYAGGYNCQHKWRPCPESLVPTAEVARVKATSEYKLWAKRKQAA